MRLTIAKVLSALTLCYCIQSSANTTQVDVFYSKLEKSDLALSLTGNVEALNDALLTSLESGTVKTIKAEVGDHVEQGQILLTLDDDLIQIMLAQAKAELASAKVSLQETVRLYNEIIDLAKKEVVAKTLLAERKSNVAHSEALLAQAKAKVAMQIKILDRHTLTAPFTGTIAQRNTDIGEWVSPQSTVFQLVSDDNLRVMIDIPQQYFNQLTQTKMIKTLVSPDNNNQAALSLPLSAYAKVSDPISRTFSARIDLPSNSGLISGMSAAVQLVLPNGNQFQVQLPKSALKRHPDGSYSVFAVVNGKVERIGVKLIRSSLHHAIVAGVADNMAIITSGNELLVSGMAVKVNATKGAN